MKDRELDDICEQYYNTIYRYCFHKTDKDTHKADDITSDTFYLLIQKWNNFHSHSPKSVLAWLYKTAKLKILEYSRQSSPIPMEETQADNDAYLDSMKEMQKYGEYINIIEQKLSDTERILFEYLVVEQRSYQEVAELLEASEHAIIMRWFRLRNKIGKWIPNIFQ